MKINRHIIIAIVSMIILLIYTMVVYHSESEKRDNVNFIDEMITKQAIVVFETLVSIRQWVANHDGIYIDRKYDQGLDEYTNKNNIYSEQNNLLIKVVPDTLTKSISQISTNSMDLSFRMTSLNPLNPENKANAFDEKAFQYFKTHPKQTYYYERSEDFSKYQFVGVLLANESCLKCHQSQDAKLGDMLGGISIEIPMTEYIHKFQLLQEHFRDSFIMITLLTLVLLVIVIPSIYLFYDRKELIESTNKDLKKLQFDNENLIKRYKYAVEGSQSGIWDWNLVTDDVVFDKNWKGMLGYEEDEIPNRLEEWDIRVHPDDKEKAIQDILANHHKKTEFYLNIHRLRHKQGHWVWILDRGKTYFNEEGKPVRMVGFHTDITDFKELELKLYEKEQNLMTAQEIAQMGHWRYNTASDFFIVSEALYKLLGIPRNERIASYSDFKKYVYEDDQEAFISKHKVIFQTKSKMSLQYRMRKYNSDEIIYINEEISFVYNEKANEESYIGTMQNITVLKKAEQELELFKKIIDNSPISIVITDENAKIIYVNRFFSNLTGYSKEELLGKNPRVLKSQNTKPQEYKEMWEKLIQKKTWGGIFKNIKKNGEEFWETAMIIPILDNQEQIVNYLGIKREITKEVYLEKELHEKEELMLVQSKNAAMGEMISMIAHQWRQPITTISMMANNILADIELEIFEEETAKTFALELSKQTQYLSKTIEDFRNFFKQDKSTEQSTLTELFEDIDSIISASLKNNNIEFRLNFDKEIVLQTYIRELLQVLINLIKNAKEAFENQDIENKYISIEVEDKVELLEIRVRDNAGGISKKNMPKIFEAYFTTKEEHNGTGLGLYMSKMIVQKHLKGDLTVQNTEDGVEFKVVLQKFIQ